MDEYLKSAKEGLEESKDFFSNKNKIERELWVLREFLSYLPIDFDESELSSSKQEPNDVSYFNFGFQIKEIQSLNRKRGQEYKDKLNSITESTKLENLFEQYSPIHIPLNDALPNVVSELERHRTHKYGDEAINIDVLIYLNLSETTYTKDPVKYLPEEFSFWQSVSLVSNNCAIVLACNDTKTPLIGTIVGKLYIKKKLSKQ